MSYKTDLTDDEWDLIKVDGYALIISTGKQHSSQDVAIATLSQLCLGEHTLFLSLQRKLFLFSKMNIYSCLKFRY
jgi:hypothetical protein